MHLTRLACRLVLVAAIGATCGTAAAQEKRDPRLVVRDCVTYLRLSELQHRIIERETFKLGMLKDARAKQAATASSASTPAEQTRPDQTRQVPSTTAAIDYDMEIGKLAFMMEKDRGVLTAIEHRYNECLKAPPWQVAKAVADTRAAAKKAAAKRATGRSQRAPRSGTDGRGPAKEGGHSPGASGLIGIIGGGGVGVGF